MPANPARLDIVLGWQIVEHEAVVELDLLRRELGIGRVGKDFLADAVEGVEDVANLLRQVLLGRRQPQPILEDLPSLLLGQRIPLDRRGRQGPLDKEYLLKVGSDLRPQQCPPHVVALRGRLSEQKP